MSVQIIAPLLAAGIGVASLVGLASVASRGNDTGMAPAPVPAPVEYMSGDSVLVRPTKAVIPIDRGVSRTYSGNALTATNGARTGTVNSTPTTRTITNSTRTNAGTGTGRQQNARGNGANDGQRLVVSRGPRQGQARILAPALARQQQPAQQQPAQQQPAQQQPAQQQPAQQQPARQQPSQQQPARQQPARRQPAPPAQQQPAQPQEWFYTFGYGSLNLDDVNRRLREHDPPLPELQPDRVIPARLINFKRVFCGYATTRKISPANIQPALGSYVQGIIYKLNKAEFDAIGETEGYLEERDRRLYSNANGVENNYDRWIFFKQVIDDEKKEKLRWKTTNDWKFMVHDGNRPFSKVFDDEVYTHIIDINKPNNKRFDFRNDDNVKAYLTDIAKTIKAARLNPNDLRNIDIDIYEVTKEEKVGTARFVAGQNRDSVPVLQGSLDTILKYRQNEVSKALNRRQ